MKLFNDLILKFNRPDWRHNHELCLMDTILELHPSLYGLVVGDLSNKNGATTELGRKDSPTVEQVVRGAVYKEFKSLTYRDLEYHQIDSRSCAAFVKLDERPPFSYQTWQRYIAKISPESLQNLLSELNKIAISSGLEDLSAIRADTTVVSANIHHPTNSSLVWDCIKEAYRLLSKLADAEGLEVRDYTKGAKKNHFKISNTKGDKRVTWFKKQLTLFAKSINQVDKFAKKKGYDTLEGIIWAANLATLLPLMRQVYDMAYRKGLLGEKVPNSQKLFSIYELHTDIIVKGGREVYFGHKVALVGGKSNLILGCQTYRGNPSDSSLFEGLLTQTIGQYGKTPKSVCTDGGFASKDNLAVGQKAGLVNIVFNKVLGSMQNIASSQSMATRLKKWRSGIEANISNLKRGFSLSKCEWRGWKGFQAKVLWSVIAYNIRVMAGLVAQKIA